MPWICCRMVRDELGLAVEGAGLAVDCGLGTRWPRGFIILFYPLLWMFEVLHCKNLTYFVTKRWYIGSNMTTSHLESDFPFKSSSTLVPSRRKSPWLSGCCLWYCLVFGISPLNRGSRPWTLSLWQGTVSICNLMASLCFVVFIFWLFL